VVYLGEQRQSQQNMGEIAEAVQAKKPRCHRKITIVSGTGGGDPTRYKRSLG
jgi:hypothetical protein